uniref:Uncharacterized protein n=1 Tax=Nelumbo nucifera TaxID=4432 RepID=A0A822ZKY8_NELNU|nr:TPA_asm: hypothetical protein HUJ06_000648 [Nelumbo nucifera]
MLYKEKQSYMYFARLGYIVQATKLIV